MNFVKKLEVWLGWCPHMDAAPDRGQMGVSGMVLATPPPEDIPLLQEKGIVDYGRIILMAIYLFHRREIFTTNN
ncbi:MAG: hypothetical protein JXA08_00615 [Methanomicrobiaceae archaeon]|nr:hypothetical protein [Methanomicrobiaceae archaeon]